GIEGITQMKGPVYYLAFHGDLAEEGEGIQVFHFTEHAELIDGLKQLAALYEDNEAIALTAGIIGGAILYYDDNWRDAEHAPVNALKEARRAITKGDFSKMRAYLNSIPIERKGPPVLRVVNNDDPPGN